MATENNEQTIDPRVVQTKRNLKTALEILIKSREPGKISVSALCKEAGISRHTFYQHYATIFDLYGEAVKDKLAEFEPELFSAVSSHGTPVDSIATVLQYLDDNRTSILSVIDTNTMRFGAGALVRGWIDSRLARVHFNAKLDELTPEQSDRITFTTNGLLGLVFKRLRQDEPTSTPHELASTVVRLVITSMRDSSVHE